MSAVSINAGLRGPRTVARRPSRNGRGTVRSADRTLPVRPVGARPTVVRPVRRAVRPAPVRLTRRGRVVVVVLLLAVLFAVLTAFGSHSAATGEAGTPVPTHTVEVRSGDTLWEIAASAAPPGHVREMVHQIRELNALTGSGLTVGQEIAVPLG